MTGLAAAASTGFLTSFALILAIGAQNALVLKHGILRQHVFWVCFTCAVSDAVLISAGVAGFGVIATQFPRLPNMMQIAGGIFLIFYGASRFYEAYKGNQLELANSAPTRLGPTILITLALTWLNPHVYLDTLGLLGAISTEFPSQTGKLAFGTGAVSASFVFFFSLGYGARFLAPMLRTPRAWKILDILIGALMWYLAYKLIFD
ncbi:MAG: LysE/ArgO family amino acid transporter [Paracoccaceae bacterium]|jgi:L-lysine exporter family protein LysE/ArgO